MCGSDTYLMNKRDRRHGAGCEGVGRRVVTASAPPRFAGGGLATRGRTGELLRALARRSRFQLAFLAFWPTWGAARERATGAGGGAL